MTISLTGLTAAPLSHYLSALGLIRVIAEQLDPTIAGHWNVETFMLEGVDETAVLDFLDERFCPSPVFSPWNKEGDPEQNAKSRAQIDQLRASPDPRFVPYQETFSAFERLRHSSDWGSLSKPDRLALWRANVPDSGLGWLDTAFVLKDQDDPSFPPLLGSGGNDGRFEFSRLLHGELIRLFINERTRQHRRGWLASLLFGRPGPALVDSTLGMYNADATGTPNSAASGSAPSATNPWSIVLTFEGLISLGGSAASRMGMARTQLASAPFMVRSSSLGATSAPAEDSRGEFWAPLWDRPTQWNELRRLLGEGRLDWNGRQARSSLDAARAIGNLGVDRGVTAFQRFDLVRRNGLSYVAAPSGRTRVTEVHGVDLLAPLDKWTDAVRRQASRSAAIEQAVRRFDRLQIALVEQGGSPSTLLEILVQLASIERLVGRNAAIRERIPPLPRFDGADPLLPAEGWLDALSELHSDPALIAAVGLASLRDERASTATPDAPTMPYPTMALALRGLRHAGHRGVDWPDEPGRRDVDAVAASRAGDQVALEVFSRRIRATSESPDDVARSGPGYTIGLHVPLRVAMQLVDGSIDPVTVLALARGLAMLDGWNPARLRPSPEPPNRPRAHQNVDLWFAAVRRCCATRSELEAARAFSADADAFIDQGLRISRSWGRELAASRAHQVGEVALRRVRNAGITAIQTTISPPAGDASALAIALLLQLRPADLATLSAAMSPTTTRNTERQPE